MTRLCLTLFLALLLGGCSSNTKIDRSKQIGSVQRFFVISNANDSRALDRHIANALRSHGLTAEAGPKTMMPDDAQAVVTYQDNWTWDFGDRLMYLQITVRDARSNQPIANMEYGAKIPKKQPPAQVIADLVNRLLAADK